MRGEKYPTFPMGFIILITIMLSSIWIIQIHSRAPPRFSMRKQKHIHQGSIVEIGLPDVLEPWLILIIVKL